MSRRHQKEQPEDSSDEGSFADFDQEDDISMSDSENGSDTQRQDAAILEKDSDEEDLERLVLGSKATWRDQLFRDDFLLDVIDSNALVVSGGDEGTGKEHLADSMLFAIDTSKPTENDEVLVSAYQPSEHKKSQDPPAWEDSDDERLTVSLATASRLRKLRTFEGEDVVNGVEYSERLRQQYLRLYPLPEWAKPATSKRRRRRSSAAASDSNSDLSGSDFSADENDDDGEIDSSTLPLDAFLRSASSFAPASNSQKRRKLRPETIDIQRTRDISDAHSKSSGVSCLAFHPTLPILLSTSVSSLMYLHSIDPAAYPTPNPLLTSVQVKRTDLRRAAFASPEEVIFAGRRKYLHSWNLTTGNVKKVTKIQGHQKEHKTMERFRVSADGRYMAIAASDKKGGGMVNIVNVNTMQWIAQARIDGRGGVADFQWWSDGNGLTIAGKDGQVAEWSLVTRRTVGVWRDEGSVGGTVMVLGGANGPQELGGDRWAAVGNTSGILNVYDRGELLVKGKRKGKGGEAEVKKLPTPTRTFEQLTTAISVAQFSPDGQLLAFGSVHKKDAMRLVHMPSCTVYRNWPTEQTPLGRITAVAFSAQSDVLAVGNDAGRVRLWEIRG